MITSGTAGIGSLRGLRPRCSFARAKVQNLDLSQISWGRSVPTLAAAKTRPAPAIAPGVTQPSNNLTEFAFKRINSGVGQLTLLQRRHTIPVQGSVNEGQLRKVILNLLQNSIDAMAAVVDNHR